MSGISNVGGRGVYEAGDQRTAPNSEINKAERYKEGQPHSHLPNDSSKRHSPAYQEKLVQNTDASLQRMSGQLRTSLLVKRR